MASLFRCCIAPPPFDADAFYPVRPDCRDDAPPTRFRPRPGLTLSKRKWDSLFSEDGQLDIIGMLRRVQRGGVHPTIKGPVWEFLLGCYDPKSTTTQRDEIRSRRRQEYEKLKSKCQEMDQTVGSGKYITAPIVTEDGRPIQYPADGVTPVPDEGTSGAVQSDLQTECVQLDKEVMQWKLTLHQIGLDVVRTDRSLVYYEDQAKLARLWDILAVYSWIDKDIGYCQGMSDLCSPVSILIENEADAFWCFQHLMQRVRGNFKSTSTSIGVRSQLGTLSSIMKAVDPKLHEHIDNLDGGEYLFAFRMLMVLFRREYSFVDSLYLWELMLAMEYNPNLFTMYETEAATPSAEGTSDQILKQCGKFERANLRAGQKEEHIPLSIFLMASLLEAKNKALLKDAKGLDDLVKILNDVTGNLDVKKACRKALNIHKKYLATVKVSAVQ